MSAATDAIHDLAARVEAASSVRTALVDWGRGWGDPVVERVGRLAALGASLPVALAPLSSWSGGSLAARAVQAHARYGGSLAGTLRAIAAALEAREQMAHEARAASAAAKLSARLLAGLVLVSLPLLPAGGGSRPGSVVVTSSMALALGGVGAAWTRKLCPRPPVADSPAVIAAELIAALLDAGLHPAAAVDVACGEDPTIRRLVALGMSRSEALGRSSERGFGEMGRVMRQAEGSGSPVAESLRRLAAQLRSDRRRDDELAARRAPVLLVLPLTLCFLPAFGLALAGPLIRGLSG